MSFSSFCCNLKNLDIWFFQIYEETWKWLCMNQIGLNQSQSRLNTTQKITWHKSQNHPNVQKDLGAVLQMFSAFLNNDIIVFLKNSYKL